MERPTGLGPVTGLILEISALPLSYGRIQINFRGKGASWQLKDSDEVRGKKG